MKKYIMAACTAVFLISTGASGQTTLTGALNTDSTLPAHSCYYLDDCLVVRSGSTLTIEEGVTVLAHEGAVLVVEPGARLVVNGTEADPVVFTSAEDPENREAGNWYGIIIGGLSYTNDGQLGMGNCTNVVAGGNLPADNSATIRYLQVHFAGGNTEPKLDNALTFNALGSGTILEHIQVTNSAANSFGIYGGTANMSYLFSLDARRDDFRFSDGYEAKAQYLLAIRKDPGAHHSEKSHGIFIQNKGNFPYTGSPLTAPVISNASVIGPGLCNEGPFDSEFYDAVHFTKNGGGSIYNTVVMNWPGHGLYIDDSLSVKHTSTDVLNFSYNSFYNNGTSHGSVSWSGGCSSNMNSWINGTGSSCLEDGNQTTATDPAYDGSICGTYCNARFSPEFVIDEIHTELDPPEFGFPGGNTWFDDEAAYRGAIQAEDLYTAWSDLCPEERVYCTGNASRQRQQPADRQLRLAPNPAQGTAYALFDATGAGAIRIEVLDRITGQSLLTVNTRVHNAGAQRIPVSVQGLQPGVYIVKISLPEGSILTAQLFVL